MGSDVDKREWQAFTEHKRLMDERARFFEQAKAGNTLYLPLLGSTVKFIEDECVQCQMNAATKLLNKSVYVLRGTTDTSSVFGGLIFVECILRSNNRDVCVYVEGPLTNEQGVIYEDLIVRVAVRAHTYIRFR